VTARAATSRTAGAVGRLAAFAGILLAVLAGVAGAQQLEPRAYSPAPVGTNYFGLALHDSRGGVVTDAALPLEDVEAHINITTPFYGRTFSLAGRSANVGIAVPYAWGTVAGEVFEEHREVRRSGFGDPQLRFAVNLLGGPAMTPREFATRARRTTLGFSLVASVPVGEYDPSKLINLGTNRWAYRPELGLSLPAGKWDLELYGGVWLFGANDDFFGGVHREQEPLPTAQAHVVYTLRRSLWLAADFTYYWGGTTSADGVQGDDRQDNTRGGLTMAIPIVGRQSLKLTWARGVSTRVGSSFQTFGVAWQWVWFDRSSPKKPS
jgi:hypothetical protein